MFKLTEITENLNEAVTRYQNISLLDCNGLSEILREIGVNLSYLVQVRDEYYQKYQNVYFNSQENTSAGKTREADRKVPELDLVRKILRHYGELQKDIRTQISLHKN